MLKIYGADLSSPSNKVRYAANKMQLEYEYVYIKIKDGDNRTPEYLKIHPAGKIPAIDDDGFVLFESNAIIKYLAAKQKAGIYPQEIKAKAQVDQWMDFISMHVESAMGRILFNRVFCRFAKVEPDKRSEEDGIRFLNKYLPIIDKQLQHGVFLLGQEFTLADICLLAALDPAEIGGVDISSFSNIMLWRETLTKQAFYQQCHKKYGERIETILSRQK